MSMKRLAVFLFVPALVMCGGSFAAIDSGDDSACSGGSCDGGRNARASDTGVTGSKDTGVSGTDAAAHDSGSTPAPDAGPLPGILPNMSLWLEGDVGIVDDVTSPGHVKRWLDQSGNNNDAVEPNTSTDTVDPMSLNRHDVIDMGGNGSAFSIASASTMDFGAGDFAIFLVIKNDPNTESIYWSNGNDPGLVFFYLPAAQSGGEGSIYRLILGDRIVDVAADNGAAFHIFTLRGALPELRLDGVAKDGDVNDAGAIGLGQSILMASSSSTAIAEAIAVKGTVTDMQVVNVESYLKTKYGL